MIYLIFRESDISEIGKHLLLFLAKHVLGRNC